MANAHIGGEPLSTWKGVPVGERVRKALAAWEAEGGKPVVLTDGYRSHAQQVDLYQRKPGLAAKPGSSYHERGLAIDVNPSTFGGYGTREYARFVAFMKGQGFAWGGDFRRVKEPWHFGLGEGSATPNTTTATVRAPAATAATPAPAPAAPRERVDVQPVIVLPSDDEVRELFRSLLGEEPSDVELRRFTGKQLDDARDDMLATEDALMWSLTQGITALRSTLRGG